MADGHKLLDKGRTALEKEQKFGKAGKGGTVSKGTASIVRGSAAKRKPVANKGEGRIIEGQKHPNPVVVKAKKQPREKSNIKSKISNDQIVYVSQGERPRLEFSNEGIPVYTISFTEKLNIIKTGFTKKELLELRERYGMSLETVAKILDINLRTIQNKSNEFKFTGSVAEKILGLAELYSYGLEVFEERDKFRKWLITSNPILESKRPLDLFTTNLGMQQVNHELGRIDFGIY